METDRVITGACQKCGQGRGECACPDLISDTPRTNAFRDSCATYECLRLAKKRENPRKATLSEIEFMMAIEIAREHEKKSGRHKRALQKIIAHTGTLPGAQKDLLLGLLASIKRIAEESL